MNGHAAWIFTYQIVRQNDPLWRVRRAEEVLAPPYGGELWVDQKNWGPTPLSFQSRLKSRKFPTQSADLQTDYEDVAFADGTSFALPVAATIATREQGEEVKAQRGAIPKLP